MKPGRQLHLAMLDPIPRPGERVTDPGVFQRHICDGARACPHLARCMAQPISPQAQCFTAPEPAS